MDSQKTELENKVSELTKVYVQMLNSLADIYDEKEQIEKQLQEFEHNFKSVLLLTDCIVFKLNESKKSLNALYNNEEFTPIPKFIFSRDMVKTPSE